MVQRNYIEFLFIRPTVDGSAADRHEDDRLRIAKLGENRVRLSYSERTSRGRTVDVQLLDYNQMLAYMCRLFTLLSIDDDPFRSVQINLPGYPRILLMVSTLQANIRVILESLQATCLNWPQNRGGNENGDEDD